MPISSPRRGRSNLFSLLQTILVAAALASVTLLAVSAPAQTLAHPNWVGNGMSTDPWYQHAVIYRIDGTPAATPTFTAASIAQAAAPGRVDFRYLAPRIHALRSVGVDALLLPAPEIPDQSAAAPAPNDSGDPGSTQIDQLDDLIRVASNRGVRILLTLQSPSGAADLTGLARFWLNRGVAGFYIEAPAGSNSAEMQASVQLLRRQVASVVGQRIVISNLDLAMPDASVPVQAAAPIVRRSGTTHSPHASDTAPQLELDARLNSVPRLDAATLRPMLIQTVGQAYLLQDFDPAKGIASSVSASPSTASSQGLAEIRATVALLTHPASIIESDAKLVLEPIPERLELDDEQPKPAPTPAPQPGVFLPYKAYVPPKKNTLADITPKDPLTLWYKQLATLHHGNAAFRGGTTTFLNFDAQNALVWVGRPATVTNIAPAIVVVCNLSASEVKLSLKSEIESLGLRGNYLRTLLRSDRTMGPQELDSVTLPPYSVYVGELRR
jgi:hypothetical protein